MSKQLGRTENNQTLFSDYSIFTGKLENISIHYRTIISTLNAHSFNMAYQNAHFKEALQASDILLPDGVSIVKAARYLTGQKIQKIAGADIFYHLIKELDKAGSKCFFLGSTDETLQKIKTRLSKEYASIIPAFYSPPFKPVFSIEDDEKMLQLINAFKPHVLFVGMTAPKQEMWVHKHKANIQANVICSIGAVFDFYAGTIKRAPEWMIKMGLEWLYRLVKEPRRMWKRYLIGNSQFIWLVLKEKWKMNFIKK